MADDRPPREPPSNMLGKTSLILGILASTCVVFVVMCAGVAQQQGWLTTATKPIFGVLGGTCSFVGFASALMGLVALFQRSRSRGIAIVGMILGMVAVLLFAAAVNNANK